MNFTQLYQQIPWLRDLEKPKQLKTAVKKEGDEAPVFENALQKGAPTTKKANPAKVFVGNLVSMLKNASFSYQLKENTEMPGFAYKPDYFGNNFNHMQPGLKFVLGMQDSRLRYKLADLGALKRILVSPTFIETIKTRTYREISRLNPLKTSGFD